MQIQLYHYTIIFSLLFSLVVAYDCPYNCIHGECVDNSCKCDDNWTGVACQNEIIDLKPGNSLKKTISYGENDTLPIYVYFRTLIQSGDHFSLNISSENCLVNVYSGYNLIPDDSKYDYATYGNSNITDHVIFSPFKGSWLHGVTSSVNCTFTTFYNMSKSCPLDCSGHGTCNSTLGTCNCSPNYTGEDCSIPIKTLTTQKSFSDSTIVGNYNYYKMEVNSNILDIEITREMDDKTCDVYLGYNFLPSLSNYSYMLENSINSKNLSIHIDKPKQGTWYIAVWGCKEYDYTILPIFTNMCPNNCSGHGTCKNGICTCNANYLLEDCSKYVRSNLSDSFIEEFEGNQWKYFRINATLSSEIAIIVNATSEESSFDIFYDIENEPNTFKYKKFKSCSTKLCSLIDKIEKSSVWVGIHNTLDLQLKLNISITLQKKCPNECNNHGKCIAGKCTCDENYTSSDCSIYMENLSNSTVTGTVKKHSMNFYRLRVNNFSTVIFNITGINKGPVDVFLDYDVLPTPTENFKRFYNVSTNLVIEVTSADARSASTWYLGIYGVDAANFELSGASFSTCPKNCSGNGQCESGVCNCTEEWTSIDCSVPIVDIPPNLQLRGTAHFEVWDYYTFTITTNEAFQIIVEQLMPYHRASTQTYLGKFKLPNKYEYDHKNTTYKEQSIIIPANISKGTWFIGITSDFSDGIEYRLIVATGCESYLSCNQCILDPNCGWCRANLQDSSGLCVPGDSDKALNQTCLFYQYSTCEPRNDKLFAPSFRFIIGLISGIGAVIVVFIITFFVYKEYRRMRKEKLKPLILNFKSKEEEEEEYLFNDEAENKVVHYNSNDSNDTIEPKNDDLFEKSKFEDIKQIILESDKEENSIAESPSDIPEKKDKEKPFIDSYDFDEYKEEKKNLYTDSDSTGDMSSDSDEEYNISKDLF